MTMSDNLFEGTIKSDTITEWFETFSPLVQEARINLHDDAWEVKCVDPANVASVYTSLSDSGFTSFEYGREDGAVFGANLNSVEEAIGFAPSDETVHLTFPDEHKIHIDAGGVNYTRAGINPDSIRKEPQLPELEFSARGVGVSAEGIKRGIKAADMVSDHVSFVADVHDETLKMVAKGDTDDATADLTEHTDDLEIDANAESTYSVEYLQSFKRGIPDDVKVNLHLDTAFPLKIDFGHAEGHATTTMMLAPRIDSQ